MNEDILKSLIEYGLKKHEADVFLYLVGKNKLTAYEIAKDLKLYRSSTYEILNRLIEKGFVSKSNLGKSSYFKANELTSVISKLKTKQDVITSLIPKLNSIKSDQPETRILIGEQGQKQYNFELIDLIKRKKINELYMIGNAPPDKESSILFLERIFGEVKKLNPKKYGIFKAIWSEQYRKSKFVSNYERFGKNKFLKEIPSEATAFIANNFVGFFFTEDDVPYVVEIKSKVISKEMKFYFEQMWEKSKD